MEVIGAPEPSAMGAVAPSFYVGATHHTEPVPFEDGFEMRFVRLEPGARCRPHLSRSGRLLHVVAGEAAVADPLERAVVGRGDTVVIPAGEWHWHGGLPHGLAVLLIVERATDLVFDVPQLDWADGYDVPPATA